MLQLKLLLWPLGAVSSSYAVFMSNEEIRVTTVMCRATVGRRCEPPIHSESESGRWRPGFEGLARV